MKRETIFSPCRRYRYTLWREWGQLPLGFLEDPHHDWHLGRPDQYVQFVCLNPSTADEKVDDPTVRRCADYARRWGFGAFCMTNIFAWRDTDPYKMMWVPEPVQHGHVNLGPCWIPKTDLVVPANDHYLLEVARDAGIVVAAWGKHGDHRGRGKEVFEMFQMAGLRLHCLKTNGDGSPQHPLYLAKDLTPVPYQGRPL